jgi:MFS family permease
MKVVREVFFGWRVVGTAFVVAVFGFGINFYGPPIFLQVLHKSRGWPVSLISVAITVHFLVGAIVVANLAGLHRRFGIIAITRAGALLTALGFVGWAFAREPWQLFLATPISGAGWGMTSAAALNAMVVPWFNRRRPMALGMAFNGGSMGGVLFSPLWVLLIAQIGILRATLLAGSAMALVLWFLAGRYLGRSPAAMGLVPDGNRPDGNRGDAQPSAAARSVAVTATPLPRPWQDRRFITLAVATTLSLFAQIGMVTQLFSLLSPILGEAGAGITMGAVTACAIGGRSLLGAVMPDTTNRRMIAAVNYSVQAAGSIVLLSAGPSVALLLLGCGLFGLGFGNVTSLPPLIAQSDFGASDVLRVVPLVTAVSQAGYAFAPAVFGLLRDIGSAVHAASYLGPAPLLFAAAAALQLAAAGMVLLGRQPARKETEVLTAG